MKMKKFAIITAAALVAASVSSAYAQGTTSPGDQTKQHKAMKKSDMTTGSATRSSRNPISSRKPMAGDNDELKGDSATSAGGANSLSNTNNPGGMGNNAGPPMR
jgi:hypothetical protein